MVAAYPLAELLISVHVTPTALAMKEEEGIRFAVPHYQIVKVITGRIHFFM